MTDFLWSRRCPPDVRQPVMSCSSASFCTVPVDRPRICAVSPDVMKGRSWWDGSVCLCFMGMFLGMDEMRLRVDEAVAVGRAGQCGPHANIASELTQLLQFGGVVDVAADDVDAHQVFEDHQGFHLLGVQAWVGVRLAQRRDLDALNQTAVEPRKICAGAIKGVDHQLQLFKWFALQLPQNLMAMHLQPVQAHLQFQTCGTQVDLLAELLNFVFQVRRGDLVGAQVDQNSALCVVFDPRLKLAQGCLQSPIPHRQDVAVGFCVADEFIGPQMDVGALAARLHDPNFDAPQLPTGQVNQGFIRQVYAGLSKCVLNPGAEPLVWPTQGLVWACAWAVGWCIKTFLCREKFHVDGTLVPASIHLRVGGDCGVQ